MSKQILVVDDSVSIRKMVGFILKNAGYSVVEAVDGQDGVNRSKEAVFDLVITDINMPNKNGYETVTELRMDPTYAKTPILIMTTESDDEKKKMGKECGATGWIVKPFNPELLLKIIDRLLPQAAQKTA